jgi:hypothetical protein
MSRLRVIAGSTLWKKRRCSRKSAEQAHGVDRFVRFAVLVLDNEFEIQRPQRLADPADNLGVGIDMRRIPEL